MWTLGALALWAHIPGMKNKKNSSLGEYQLRCMMNPIVKTKTDRYEKGTMRHKFMPNLTTDNGKTYGHGRKLTLRIGGINGPTEFMGQLLEPLVELGLPTKR